MSGHGQCGLDWHRVGFDKQVFKHRIKTIVEFERGLSVACGKQTDHLSHLAWDDIRCDADDTLRAYSHERKRQAVVATKDHKLGSQCGSKLRDTIRRSARLLDSNDV